MKYLSLVTIAACCALAASCNNDIFIPADEQPTELKVEVDGDNATAEISIRTKNLRTISIETYGGELPVTYYDKKGNEVSGDVAFKNLGSIVYESDWLNFRIVVDGSKLWVETLGNSSGSYYHFSLRLDYSYALGFVDLYINEGLPPELVSIDYSGSIFENTSTVNERSLLYTNNSDSPTVWHLCPYLNYQMDYVVEPSEPWAMYKEVKMRLPEYSGGVWHYGDAWDVKLGTPNSIISEYDGERIPVEVGPHQAVRIVSSVVLSEAEASGEITLRNPITGKEFSTFYRTLAKFPIDYEIRIEEVN